MVSTTKKAHDISAIWLHRLARPQWKPVAEAFRYRATTKKPTSISPIRPMYFQGYMLPSGIFVASPCPKTSPIWGMRLALVGITLSTVNSAVKPKAPTESLRNVSIGFMAKRNLWTKYAVDAMLSTASQSARKLKTQDLSPSMIVLNDSGALSRMPLRYPYPMTGWMIRNPKPQR